MPVIGRLRYLEAAADGSERPRGTLLLIHAFPLNARMWEPQLALASNGWRVIAPQLRGMDGGSTDQAATSMDEHAGDIIDLLDALHVEDAVVGGLSMGGYVAFALLRHAARYVRGLVLADTRPQADTPEGVEGRRKMLALVREKGPAAVADEMIPKLLGEDTRRTRTDVAQAVRALILASSADAIAHAVTALMTRADSTPLLASIHVPTLILVGEQDTITPPALSEQMHQAIKGSEYIAIPGAGHLSNLEQPEAFNAALARFLEHRV
jgi:pimeloyl-ACP methyl ester carboxylesterase